MSDSIPEKMNYPFLVTTAIEEFWDTSKQLLFLGEWCLRYSRKSFWQPLGGEVLEYPWQSRRDISIASGYAYSLYERLLPLLAQALNDLHDVSYSTRYWRIVIGPWLQLYLTTVYDRYLSLRTALNKYPDLTTIILSSKSFVTPRDTLEFSQHLKGDSYNLQIYSRILHILGKEYPEKSLTVASMPFVFPDKNPFAKIKKNALKLFFSMNRAFKEGHSVILRSSYFSADAQLQFVLRTRGRVWSVVGDPYEMPIMEINNGARESLRRCFTRHNEFEVLLGEMLSLDVPTSFIEGYDHIGQALKHEYPSPPKAIMSAVGWYCDEPFKQWAADAAEQGTTLLGMQHGGNYGCLACNPGEDNEIAIADRYYTWGWERPDIPGKVFPRSAGKLSGRKLLVACNEKEGILFVSTTSVRYFREFPFFPQDFSEYLVWQRRFLARFSSALLPMLRVRLHREDNGWDMKERWRESCPDIRFEDWSIPLAQSLDNCRLYVSDHLGTTYLEALAVGKPTILFWNPVANALRPEAQHLFDGLRDAGILFDAPELAADAVNSVYPDVKLWWNEPIRQVARRNFCDRFAVTSPKAVKEWVDEFKRVVEGSFSKDSSGQ